MLTYGFAVSLLTLNKTDVTKLSFSSYATKFSGKHLSSVGDIYWDILCQLDYIKDNWAN